MFTFINGLKQKEAINLLKMIAASSVIVTVKELSEMLVKNEIMPSTCPGHISHRISSIMEHCKTSYGYDLSKFDIEKIKNNNCKLMPEHESESLFDWLTE